MGFPGVGVIDGYGCIYEAVGILDQPAIRLRNSPSAEILQYQESIKVVAACDIDLFVCVLVIIEPGRRLQKRGI